jgi:hypothetical protein
VTPPERREILFRWLAATCEYVKARHRSAPKDKWTNKQMKNEAPSSDPLWGRVSKWITAAPISSVRLVEARGDAISELTAYYNKVDADLASAIEGTRQYEKEVR